MNSRTITIIGAGYVGLSTAAILSNCEYKVYLVDIDHQRLKIVSSGKSFFYEEGINSLIKHGIREKKLIPTSSYSESIPKSQFVFSAVGTPDNPDGSSNLSYVFSAVKEAAKHMENGTIFTQKSTVPVGTGERIENIFKDYGKDINYVSNPEFLREGSAISDSLWFDRIVAGGDNKQAVEKVLNIYRDVEKHRAKLTNRTGLKKITEKDGEYINTTRNSAELIKVTANAFLALKISFANSIAKLADKTGADITQVMDAVGADKRIGRSFLNAGRGYGGGCFPKDVSGLISSASEYGVDLGIMVAASDLNETMPGYIANKAKETLGKLEGKRVAVLGLAFKAGTSDARKSPGVKLANIFHSNGSIVKTFDPQAKTEAKKDLLKGIATSKSIKECVKQADAIVISTDWIEFIDMDLSEIKKLMKGNLFVDAVNAFSKEDVTGVGLSYTGVGRN